MALHKMLGSELEYGLAVDLRYRGELAEACADLIQSYVSAHESVPSPWRRSGVWLSNGSRFYVDHSHPEYASVECGDAMQATLYDHAGRVVLARGAQALNQRLGFESVTPIRNNIDAEGNSYGYHQNVLTARHATHRKMVRYAVPYLVSRQVWQGSGWLSGDPDAPFHVSQRGHLFATMQSPSTTARRPLWNTRDEPHAGPDFRRAHVIFADANMSQLQTLVTHGSLAMVIAMVEDGCLDDIPALGDPVAEAHAVARDVRLDHKLESVDGERLSALDLQRRYLERAERYVEHGADCLGGEAVARRVLEAWRFLLDGLEADPATLAGHIDWVSKHRLFERMVERNGPRALLSAKARKLDVLFHGVDMAGPLASLHRRDLFDEATLEQASRRPPTGSRGELRELMRHHFDAELDWQKVRIEAGHGFWSGARLIDLADPTPSVTVPLAAALRAARTAGEATRVLDATGRVSEHWSYAVHDAESALRLGL